jgi:predicted phosphodiesterase
MTRIAIISDIHSNWHALQSVWARIVELDCDEIYCLGDVVGYGASPVECLNHLRDHEVTCVQGNHDALVSDGTLNLSFNDHSLKAVEHNRKLLNQEQLDYLKGLPVFIQPEEGISLAHGSPEDRDRYLLYNQDYRQTAAALFQTEGPGLCFFGHTHIPIAFDGNGLISPQSGPIPISNQEMMLINPGSVGQPRDRDPRASFLYLDRENNTLNFERVQYDIETARDEILAAGLPDRLGDRLRLGR